MDRVGELVIAQSRLKQLAASSSDIALRAVAEEIERLAAEMRDTMMVVRMVPIAQLFGRFRRLIHDLARDTGKTIELSTEGEATELDKTVIERLADPLIHLIRNAADHGLETRRTTSGRRQARGRSGRSGRPPVRRRGGDHHHRRRPRRRSRPRPRQGRGERPDPARPGAERQRTAATDLRAGLLDRGGDHQPVGPRRRHGRGQAHHRGPARLDRTDQHARSGLGGLAAHPADPGDHRRPAGAGRNRSLRHPAGLGRGVRGAVGRAGRALDGPQPDHPARPAGAVHPAAPDVRHRPGARPPPEDRRGLHRPGTRRPGRRPDPRRPPDRHQGAVGPSTPRSAPSRAPPSWATAAWP
jgi:hypothetical protein